MTTHQSFLTPRAFCEAIFADPGSLLTDQQRSEDMIPPRLQEALSHLAPARLDRPTVYTAMAHHIAQHCGLDLCTTQAPREHDSRLPSVFNALLHGISPDAWGSTWAPRKPSWPDIPSCLQANALG